MSNAQSMMASTDVSQVARHECSGKDTEGKSFFPRQHTVGQMKRDGHGEVDGEQAEDEDRPMDAEVHQADEQDEQDG